MFVSSSNSIKQAGSERIERSEVTGEQLKEAQAINKSLSALGDVISSLQRRTAHVSGGRGLHCARSKVCHHAQHAFPATIAHTRTPLHSLHKYTQVPYRNSKLTQVLQDSLCGSSKVLLVCNLSPEGASVPETLSSLNFASRAAQVELGQVKKAAADKQQAGGAGSPSAGGAGSPGGSEGGGGAREAGGSGGGADSRASSPGSSPVRPHTGGGARVTSRLSDKAAGGGGSPSASTGGSPRVAPGVFAKPARH